jgi:hypothetical protein
MAPGVSAVAKPSRTTLLVVTAAMVLVVGLVAAGRLSQPGLRRPGPATRASPAPALVLPASRPAVTPITVDGPVEDIAVSPFGVWIVHQGVLSRVDPWTDRVVETVWGDRPPSGRSVVGVAAGRGVVWASVVGEGLLQIDPATARVVARVAVATPARVAARAGDVWVVCCGPDAAPDAGLVRVQLGRVLARIALPGPPDAVGVGASGVWVRGTTGVVWRVDPGSLRVAATVRPPRGRGGTGGGVVVTYDGVWVSDPANATVWHIDPDRNRVDGRLEADGRGLAVEADGTVWMTSGSRLLGVSHGVVRRSRTLDELGSDQINAIAAGPDALWVAAPTGLFRVSLAALP